MIEFEALKADSLEETLDILADKNKNVEIIAGGTDLLVKIHKESEDLVDMKYLLDISSILNLKQIEDQKDYLSLGALTTHSEIINSEIIDQKIPILNKAAEVIGSTQIRNRGTVGGNIINASPAADLVTALIALNAKVVLQSQNNKRELPLNKFITGPYRTNKKETEILTEIKIPYIKDDYYHSYLKVKRRQAVAIARINLAVVTRIKKNRFTDLRIAFGSATPKAIRFNNIEGLLKDKDIDNIDYEKIVKKTGQEMVKITGERWSTPYKKPVVGNLLKRALRNIVKEVQ